MKAQIVGIYLTYSSASSSRLYYSDPHPSRAVELLRVGKLQHYLGRLKEAQGSFTQVCYQMIFGRITYFRDIRTVMRPSMAIGCILPCSQARRLSDCCLNGGMDVSALILPSVCWCLIRFCDIKLSRSQADYVQMPKQGQKGLFFILKLTGFMKWLTERILSLILP